MVDKTVRGLVVFLSIFSIWVIISNTINVSKIQKENKIVVDSLIKSTDSIRYLKDSINNDLFIQSTNVTRYEIALERLREEDSLFAKKFEDKLNNIE